MAQTILLNGLAYVIPDTGETDWGQNLTNYFVAIPQGVLQKTGGNFTLTSDVNFGPGFGIFAKYLISVGLNPASVGFVRLTKDEFIAWRNNANDGDLLLGVDATDNLTFNGISFQPSGTYISQLTGDVTAIGPGVAVATITPEIIDNADISPSAGIERSKLASGTAFRILANNSLGVMSENAALTPNYVLYVDANGQLVSEQYLSKSRGGTGSNVSGVTFPTTGTLATLAGVETLTNKTISRVDNTLSGFTSNAVPVADLSGTLLAGIAPGTTGNVLTSNGTNWQSSAPTFSVGSQGTVTVFTANGTFTTPASSGTSTVYEYEIIAGGGGGGGCNGSNAVGGGGGGGAYARGTFTGVAASTGIAVTVGAAGAAGTAAGGNGGGGATSSLGSPVSITCTGGAGGAGSTSTGSTSSAGGVGGSVTGTPNILSIAGAAGGIGISQASAFALSGIGASALLGLPGTPVAGGAGRDSKGYGAGGGGAGFGTGAGGIGGAGIVIITQLKP